MDSYASRPAAERALLEEAFDQLLTERERKVLFLYHGLDDGEPRTVDQIGALLGVGRDDVRRMLREATVRLLSSPHGAEIESVMRSWDITLRPRDELEPITAVEPIGIVIDPGDASAQELADLYLALSDLYRAHGGYGIAFRPEGTEISFVAGAL